jgi:hypothetical protein
MTLCLEDWGEPFPFFPQKTELFFIELGKLTGQPCVFPTRQRTT